MAKPAHREGTLAHKNRKNHSNRVHDSASAQHNHSRHDSDAKMETSSIRARDIYVSSAHPARHQYVDSDHRSSSKRAHNEAGEGVYLQKVFTQAGMASYCMAEKLIGGDRIEVDGKIVTRQGVWADPSTSMIRVDGSRVIVDEDMQYSVLNKPRGAQPTMHDDMGHPCVSDIIGEEISAGQRLFHVGRLDAATEGLLLLTNDGELVNRLMRPGYEITKTYMATVVGEVDSKAMREPEKDIELDDGITKTDMVQIIGAWQGRSIARTELHGGRKHIVRRMLKTADSPVERLVRAKIHTVQLGEQALGTLRALNRAELIPLCNAVGL